MVGRTRARCATRLAITLICTSIATSVPAIAGAPAVPSLPDIAVLPIEVIAVPDFDRDDDADDDPGEILRWKIDKHTPFGSAVP